MSDDIRLQRKCYYASPEYSSSFWGKFIYLYQGNGSLRLTKNALRLENCPGAVEIPFTAIKGITAGRFSSWAKPLPLKYLKVAYTQDDESRAILLVPHESAFDSTQVTSEIVTSWQQTLLGIDELTNRVETPVFEPEGPRTLGKGFMMTTTVLMPLAIVGIGVACFLLFGG